MTTMCERAYLSVTALRSSVFESFLCPKIYSYFLTLCPKCIDLGIELIVATYATLPNAISLDAQPIHSIDLGCELARTPHK
jgi:hypothetical protein